MKIIESFFVIISDRSIIDKNRVYYEFNFHAASTREHNKMMQMLLEKRIDVNVQDETYDNALQTTSFENHDKMMQMLLEKKVDVNVQNEKYDNALQTTSKKIMTK